MIKIYVANLGKYNEGILQGEWFTLPADIEEIQESIGINEEYEEWAIHDYEAPFSINEYDCIDKLNELAETLDNIDKNMIPFLNDIAQEWFGGDIEETINHLDDIHMMHDIESRYDLGYRYATETGLFHNVSETIQSYFNYEAYGRDILYGGNYLYLDVKLHGSSYIGGHYVAYYN